MFTLNHVIVLQGGIPMNASEDTDPYTKLKGYFEYLMEVTPAKKSEVVFSPPYVDAWGLGKKANNRELKGAAEYFAVLGQFCAKIITLRLDS